MVKFAAQENIQAWHCGLGCKTSTGTNLILVVNVLKFETLVACQKYLGKQRRLRPYCFSEEAVCSGSPLFAFLMCVL